MITPGDIEDMKQALIEVSNAIQAIKEFLGEHDIIQNMVDVEMANKWDAMMARLSEARAAYWAIMHE